MTDNYLAGPPNMGQLFDNLLINKNKKPYSRFGSIVRDTSHGQAPAGIKRISYMWDHRDQTLEQVERDIFYLDSTYKTLKGPSLNSSFSSGDETNHISKAFWNNHSLLVGDSFCDPIKVYKDGSGDFQVRTAGMPAISAPTVTAGAAGVNNYIYAFLYYYTYIVEGVTFEDFGPTVQVNLLNAAAPDSSTVHITNIPVITNGLTKNYDTANIKVKIYRTENDLTVLKFIGEVTNGTTIYNDSQSDAAITNNVIIYTTGDVVDNDPPPPAKFVHVANNIALYGHVQEGGVVVPNRVRQSISGDIDACPESFLDDFPEDVYGINSIQSTFIVFCKSSVYRLDGFFDEQGRGGMVHLRISDTVGCVSNDSIVQTDQGLFFSAEQGFYYTDGYKVIKISDHLNDTYRNLVLTSTQARNIWGAFNKLGNRVWWAVQQDTASGDNDSCFILDLFWGISPNSTFTTASNGQSFRPTALLFRDGNMYRADNRGYVFTHNDAYASDPRVSVFDDPSDWIKKTIIYTYKSCSFNFGSSFIRKFVSKILLTLANLSNISCQIQASNDDGKKYQYLTEIRHVSNILWGDPDVTWGDPDIIWNKLGLIDEKRRFPAPGLRCNFKQIIITNSYTEVTNSDTKGKATLDATAKTMTLDNLTAAWPTEVVDYFLSTEADGYVTQFPVNTRNSDTMITFFDPTGVVPTSGDYKWLIKGYKKDESLEILSYVIHFKMLSDSQTAFHNTPSVTGANA